MKFTYALILVILFIGYAHAQMYKDWIKDSQKLFFQNGARMCHPDDKGDCNWTQYALDLVYICIVGLLIALLCFVTPVVTAFARLCDGCGGKYPSYELCCGGNEGREYSGKEVWAAKIATWVLCVPIIICVALAFNSNASVSIDIHLIGDELQNSASDIVDVLQEVNVKFLAIPYTQNVSYILDAAINVGREVEDKISNGRTTGYAYDINRSALMLTGMIITLVLLLLAVVSSLFNIRILSYIGGLVAFWMCTILWLSFALHLAVSKVTWDTCKEIDLLNSSQAPDKTFFRSGPIADIWECDSKSGINQLNLLFDEVQVYVVSQIFRGYDAFCVQSDVHCPDLTFTQDNEMAFYTQTNITDDAPVGCLDASGLICPYDFSNPNLTCTSNTPVTCPRMNLTIEQCTYGCSNNLTKEEASLIVLNHGYLLAYEDILATGIVPLLSCGVALRTLNNIKPFMCGDFIAAVFNLMLESWIAGMFLMGVCVLMIMGKKRFIRVEGK
eukprot:TRINITY_DN1023_c0_g1_i3.p1 TRINITY_DN1023_c0_g1~~TRINITY_DN1023_c0_g1_i3.p1  ORF type:complete len:500 (+),score=119.92 TRINITY_DN1023_c0_g1_i3:52-1551(+)